MTDKILIDRAVVEQALEALETGIQYDHHGNPYSDNDAARCGAYDALRAALEQPQGEQGPTPNGATHRQPKQGAFYKRVDGKWYVWSRMENGGPHRWYISPGTIEGCLEPLYTHPQNLNCKSTQARLATLWGYEKPQPPRQPLTREEIAFIAAACGGLASDFVVSVARAIEAAHGVKGRK